MSLETRIVAAVQQIGADIKDLRVTRGTLTSLSTTNKTSLVLAINELFTLIGSISSGAVINDSATNGNTTQTWSADKIFDQIEAAKTELIGGAPAALNVLGELAAALGNDPNFTTTLTTALGFRVRYDAAQTLSLAQQQQACGNIGIGNPEAAFLTTYTTARDT
jgi:hypothetical protein